ncbi:MAG: hypothetical protein IJP33_05735 [Firmicutes bacterium]|nr:hypothetical protein [Bacillota bacterium]
MFDINNKEKLMQAYIDGELNAELAASFEKELKNDINLQKEYEEQLLLHSLLQDISACDVEPPADFAACVMQRIEAEEASKTTVKKAFPWRFAAPAFGAAALLLAFGVSGIMPEAPVINQELTTTAPETTAIVAEPTTVVAETTAVEPATTVVAETTVAPETIVVEPEKTSVIPEQTQTTAEPVTVPVTEPTTTAAPEPTTVINPEQTTAPEPEKTTVVPTEKTTAAAPEQTTVAPEPPVSVPDEEINQGTASMPAPATDTVTIGGNISVMRFSVEEGDAYALFRNEAGEIQFYAGNGNETALCTVMDTKAGMQLLEESDIAIPTATTGEYDYVIKASPDGTQLAGNMGGNDSGLWISDIASSAPAQLFSAEGGGKVLEWAPNSGKLVFTNAEGSLYIAYISEGFVLMVCEEPVYSVIWCSDSRGIYFETLDENGHHVICKADLP